MVDVLHMSNMCITNDKSSQTHSKGNCYEVGSAAMQLDNTGV